MITTADLIMSTGESTKPHSPRLRWLVGTHLSVPPVVFAAATAGLDKAVVGYAMYTLTAAQVMLLCFWIGMGLARSHKFARIALAGVVYLTLELLAFTLATGGVSADAPGPFELALVLTITFAVNALLITLGSVLFVIISARYVRLDWSRDPEKLPPVHTQFSILHLMQLTSVAAMLIAVARWLSLDPGNVGAFFAFIALYFLALMINAAAAVWSALAVGPVLLRIGFSVGAAAFLGVMLALGSEGQLSGGSGLWGVLFLVPPTIVVIASLLVVRSCGYRLVRVSAQRTRAETDQ